MPRPHHLRIRSLSPAYCRWLAEESDLAYVARMFAKSVALRYSQLLK